MSETIKLHVVCGPPAGGKTCYAKKLASRLGALLIDSDIATEPVVQAGMEAVGLSADDRDSDRYKELFRDPVYESLFRLAAVNLVNLPVVLAAPFTRESQEKDWPGRLYERFMVPVEVYFVTCRPEVRFERMRSRGEARDAAKLNNWSSHSESVASAPPPFDHVLVETSSENQGE